MSTKGIADILCVSETFVKKVNRLYENTADVKDPPRRKSNARTITGKENAIF